MVLRDDRGSRYYPGRFLLLAGLLALLAGCVRPGPQPPELPGTSFPTGSAEEEAGDLAPTGPLSVQLGTAVPDYDGRPTPDPAHYEAGPGEQATFGTHTVASGESLGMIAQRYNTSIEELIALNDLANPDIITVGQQLQVPGVGIRRVVGPDFKIIPDSELVYGPASAEFDARAFANALGGRLVTHQEEVEGTMMDGPEILQLVADRYSVNPRLLLAILDHRAGWVTQAEPPSRPAILGNSGSGAAGLYGQLSWAANLLNLGYYGRSEGGLRALNIGDDTQVIFAPTINDGTAGIQRFLAEGDGVTYESWQQDSGDEGFFATYEKLFGNPFAYAFEPIVPETLTAPPLELPWAAGETWYFTGGPHGAWNSGSAWGALDFVPPSDVAGCVQSDAWVTAMAPGVVVRSGNGAVVVDLDINGEAADEYAGTGWAITYMHLETRDRVAAGAHVSTGTPLGHPSCEGGFSNGTHVHVVRSYNGRWISADGSLPFEMSGWVSSGAGSEYDGYLTRGTDAREACVCREEINAIARP